MRDSIGGVVAKGMFDVLNVEVGCVGRVPAGVQSSNRDNDVHSRALLSDLGSLNVASCLTIILVEESAPWQASLLYVCIAWLILRQSARTATVNLGLGMNRNVGHIPDAGVHYKLHALLRELTFRREHRSTHQYVAFKKWFLLLIYQLHILLSHKKWDECRACRISEGNQTRAETCRVASSFRMASSPVCPASHCANIVKYHNPFSVGNNEQ
jgi:hypothetical protein